MFALLAVVAVSGCGDASADLFAVERSGSIPDARLRMVVNDGGFVRCNGGKELTLPAKRLIDARELEKDLEEDAADTVTLGPQPGSILQYKVLNAGGTVRFADNSKANKPEFFRLALFVRRVAQGVCHLPR